jgi:hypothetical protein
MKRLIDPAVMVVAMIVPALHPKSFQKSVHNVSPSCGHWNVVWRFGVWGMTVSKMPPLKHGGI